MLALYIILGFFLFLFLLLLIPVRVDVAFREEFFLKVRYLFFAFSIMPAKEKEAAPEKEKEKEEKKKKKKEKAEGKKPGGVKEILQKTGFTGFLEALFEITKAALTTLKNIVRKVKIKRFDLYLCVGGAGDAAAAAILYGRLSAAVYSVCGALFSLVRCRQKAMTVDLDYQAPENLVDFSARFSLRPLYVVGYGLSLLGKMIPYLKLFLGIGGKKISTERKVTGNE